MPKMEKSDFVYHLWNKKSNHYFGTKIKLGRYELDWQTKLQSSVSHEILAKIEF